MEPRTCELEIIDILDEPAAAHHYRVQVTPALDRIDPPPQRRVLGDLPAPEQLADLLTLHVRSQR